MGEAPFTFEWSDPFSQTASTAVGLTEDTYTVVVTDALGCRRSTSQAVEAIEGCLFIADALTPNNDGKNDDWVVGGWRTSRSRGWWWSTAGDSVCLRRKAG